MQHSTTRQQRWTKSGVVWTSHIFLRMGSPKGFFIDGSGGGVRLFFLNFFAHLKLMVASIFLANFQVGFALLTRHWAFLWSNVCFCISCCSVYAKSNTILDIQTEALRPTGLVALQSFSNTCTGHVVLQSVQRFSETVCSLQTVQYRYAHLWVTCHLTPNPNCVVCSSFLCDWWLLPTTFHVA